MSELARETRPVAGFHQVALDGNGQLFIEPADEESLVVEAPAELLPYIGTEVRNGRLRLFQKFAGLKSLLGPHGPIHYRLTVKALDSIHVSGAGRVYSGELVAEQMDISVSGAGEVTLRVVTPRVQVSISGAGAVKLGGQTHELNIHISGSGKLAAGELNCDQVRVKLSGAGSATVRADQELEADISGAGWVRYLGQPKIHQRVSGAGQVVPAA